MSLSISSNPSRDTPGVVCKVYTVPRRGTILELPHRWDGEINVCSDIEVQDVACVGVSHKDDCVCVHAPEVLDG